MIRKHLSRKQWRNLCLISGVVLVLVGILITFLMIKAQYDDCAHRFNNNLDGFGAKYDSVWDCFFTRSEGLLIISVLFGILPFLAGCYLIRNK